jgi:hypothetical protein
MATTTLARTARVTTKPVAPGSGEARPEHHGRD